MVVVIQAEYLAGGVSTPFSDGYIEFDMNVGREDEDELIIEKGVIEAVRIVSQKNATPMELVEISSIHVTSKNSDR